MTAGLTAASCGIVYWAGTSRVSPAQCPTPSSTCGRPGASAFAPVMQYHSEFNHHQLPLRDRIPWHVAEMTGDQRVVPVFRMYAHLRERLVDYLAEQAAETVRTDHPLMRALFFNHPGDAQFWEHPRQWMLGADLLVNSGTQEGGTTWSTYLPDGVWVDVGTGATHHCRQVVERTVPIDEVPVYCRAQACAALSGARAAKSEVGIDSRHAMKDGAGSPVRAVPARVDTCPQCAPKT